MDGGADLRRGIKAIGLVSGGLDSILAVSVISRQGIEVQGVHFFNGFSPGYHKRRMLGGSIDNELEMEASAISEALSVPVDSIDITQEFISILVKPKHGYGANMNPCIDCRAFMLDMTGGLMKDYGADFVFTGEVLGQRPMSQNRRAMDIVERESGLGGLLLRPLSAKLLPATLPEKNGWVRREDLLDIQGRSRKRQMKLAAELGIVDYIQPAGGCTLTDENYARKLRDLLAASETAQLSVEETVLLSVGRHFRISGGVKIVVGRNQAENSYIERHWGGHWLASPVEIPGPTTLIQGEADGETLREAASITARYSDGKNSPVVSIRFKRDGSVVVIDAAPAADDLIEQKRI